MTWVHPEIDNPEYKEDKGEELHLTDTPYKYGHLNLHEIYEFLDKIITRSLLYCNTNITREYLREMKDYLRKSIHQLCYKGST